MRQLRSGRESEAGHRCWLITTAILLLALYIASPYYAFWRFSAALRSRDAAELQSWVDFPALRQSMKQQVNSKIAALRPQNPKRQKMFDALSGAFGSGIADSVVDAYLTPEGLAAFLADPRLPMTALPSVAPAAPPAPAPAPDAAPSSSAPVVAPETSAPAAPPSIKHLDWSPVRYAFFTSPREFLVEVDGTKLRFHFRGLRWRLRAVDLDTSKLKL